MLKTPTIVLNVKTYSEATSDKALEIAILMNKISKETDINMAIAVQATDIKLCAEKVEIPVFAEHIDPIKPGSHTGWTLPEAIKAAGANGTLINHSEHRLILADIDTCITRAKKLGLDHIVCSNNVSTSKAIATFSPNFVAIEPPELIGGDISKSVESVKKINNKVKVLCGAGVKNGHDVSKAIKLGADGVLLASGIVKADDKEKVLRDLASGL
jgi:triosephosphate isomerase